MTRRATGIRIATLNPDKPNFYGPANTRSYGTITHADDFGTDLRLRSAAPPSVAEYDAWLRGRNVRAGNSAHKTNQTGWRLRRIVIMRREGCTWKECGEAVGVKAGVARDWTEMLPRELAA